MLLAALLAVPAAAQTITRIDVPAALARQVDRIDARGHGPVLLPSRLPSEQARLYASGGSSRRGWDLELSAAADCGGANACFVATFTGAVGGEPAGRTRVALADGRRGWFTPTGCGASCSPPQIQWRERGHTYTIQARVGDGTTERREIVRLANSAIINGPRR
ncbi:MAG: hypothetical protein QOG77_3293 [Solirubrobacteraceae bacterium]|nr:hypothetical protein [Solirubrobacteraceae bacterium]